ncbi:MAG: TlpA disulfide reductase family protein [Reichenbachiella sp.]|uniref:TlpA disulfide reductase family protein n=1 Tax=Reichenbachiella sp. TaxID=2184521 RepID=UPI003263466D
MTKTIFFGLFTLILVGCSSTKTQEESTESEASVAAAQPEHFMQATDGTYYQLEDLKGKRVFINFWATWCKPCIAEMPDIQAAAQILKDENYVFFLISDQDMDKIKAFETERGFDLTFAKLSGKVQDLGIQSLPTTYVYNSNGKRVRKIGGAVKWDSEDMLASLREVE